MTSTESGVKPARRHPLDFVLMRVFCFGGGGGGFGHGHDRGAFSGVEIYCWT